jgi:hypothetical protein
VFSDTKQIKVFCTCGLLLKLYIDTKDRVVAEPCIKCLTRSYNSGYSEGNKTILND